MRARRVMVEDFLIMVEDFIDPTVRRLIVN